MSVPPGTPPLWEPAGLLFTEPAAIYHAARAISHSKLEDFRHRPAYFHRRHITREIESEKSDAFTFGAAFHCAVLEGPDAFRKQFLVSPKLDRRTKDGKEAATKFDADAKAVGAAVIDEQSAALVLRLADSVLSNNTAAELLTAPGVITEATIRTPLLRHGKYQLQCRADAVNFTNKCERAAGVPYLVDVKTCADLGEWKRQFHSYGYYRQAAFYREVISAVAHSMGADSSVVPVQRVFFIAVEKDEPHGCEVFEPDPLSLETGVTEVVGELCKLLDCYQSNRWPASLSPGGFQHVGLPEWAVKKAAA